MNAVENLKRRMRATKEEIAQHKKQEHQCRIAEVQARWTQALSAELMEELQAEITPNNVTMTYRERPGIFVANGRSDPGAIVYEWITQIDEWYVARETAGGRLLRQLNNALNTGLSEYQLRDLINTPDLAKYDLTGDPLIARAIARIKEHLDTLEQEKNAEREKAQAIKAREREQRRQTLLDLINQAETWQDWRELLPVAQEWMVPDWVGNDSFEDHELELARQQAYNRFNIHEEAREEKRQQAERDAFHPFVYYRVHYTLVAVDQDTVERYVDTRYIETLNPTPNEQGWWLPVVGAPVRFPNIAKVEHIAITEPDVMPSWCPIRNTELGPIQVPPEGADQ